MSWLFWFICVVWLIDFLLVYGYALVVMICLCDVMGVGCFEMLSVCLRLWRMGRWARAILTVGYWSETGEGCNSSCASDFRSDEMFTDSWGRAFALNLAYFCVKDLGVAVENPLKWRISEFESVRSFLQLNSQDEPFALTWKAERHYVTMFNWAAHLGLSSVLRTLVTRVTCLLVTSGGWACDRWKTSRFSCNWRDSELDQPTGPPLGHFLNLGL